MSPLLVIVHLTLVEARRRRILAAALIGGFLFLAVFSIGIFVANAEMNRTGTSFIERQATLTILTITGLYAANFLAALLAVLLPVDALSGEIDSGVIQTLASKPIRRAEIVIGKCLAYYVIVGAYLGLLSAGILLAGRLAAGYVQVNIAQAFALMLLEIAILVSVSIAGGTRLTTVANGVLTLGFYGLGFLGGWVEQIGGLAGIRSARSIGIAVSLVSPADALWRMAAFYLLPAVVRDSNELPPWALTASVPTMLMVWWAAGVMAVALVWAVRSFERRAL